MSELLHTDTSGELKIGIKVNNLLKNILTINMKNSKNKMKYICFKLFGLPEFFHHCFLYEEDRTDNILSQHCPSQMDK